MVTEKIKYTDFLGEEREEEFTFHMDKVELAELQLSRDGGMQRYITKIANAKNEREMVKVWKELLRKSYGRLSDDGRRFIKRENGQPIFYEFEESPAYEALFFKLAHDADAAAKFINGIAASASSLVNPA